MSKLVVLSSFEKLSETLGDVHFRAKTPFALEATYQQATSAPFDGYIRNAEVEVGGLVEGGSSILVLTSRMPYGCRTSNVSRVLVPRRPVAAETAILTTSHRPHRPE